MELAERRREVLKKILLRLNENQFLAVTSEPNVPLQIIAGPGTGKTSVLTSRVLYLLLERKYEPQQVIVTTFTKKAANEMIERLLQMIPNDLGIDLSKLLIGTFHSLCVRILRQNGHRIDLEPGFKIVDDRDSKDILNTLLSRQSKELEDLRNYMEELRKINKQGEYDLDIFQDSKEKNSGYDIDKIRKLISFLKSTGVDDISYANSSTKSLELSLIYSEFQRTLRKSNYLDFDDILVFTTQLLRRETCLKYLKHVLVDEFQDTNTVQLDLLFLFASQSDNHRNNVTIVGDPDQSIYGFRNAVVANFAHMRDRYKDNIQVIYLNQNYRSINSVLQASESLMMQEAETNRSLKNLVSQFEHDFKIIKNRFETNKDEADFIAQEIKLLSSMPGLFRASDFAILLRSRFHSRVIEQSLRRENIAYKVLQGKAFWELKEIQTIIDYLRCIVSDTDVVAFVRLVNVPPRGIGTKSLVKIRELIDTKKPEHESIFSFMLDQQGITNSASNGVKNFRDVIDKARDLLLNGYDIGEGIHKMFDFVVKETNLVERTRPEDPQTTDSNVKEFKREILEFEVINRSLPDPETGEIPEEELGECQSGIEFLSNFLESMDLYENEPEEDAGNSSKVVVSTIHGAKGLEWPIVFVPNLTESYFPAAWALKGDSSKKTSKSTLKRGTHLVDEERRALYVAMTRAKCSLYLNGFSKKIFGDEELEESRFLQLFDSKHFHDSNEGLQSLANLKRFYSICRKELPQDELHLKFLLSQYQSYHLELKNSLSMPSQPHKFIKSSSSKKKSIIPQWLMVPKIGGNITSAAAVMKAKSNAIPVWKNNSLKPKIRKAPSVNPKQPALSKKSFAPTYVYNKRSFK